MGAEDRAHSMTSGAPSRQRYRRPRKERDVANVRFSIAMSLDGFTAGPNQSEEHPLGEGGEDLHEWVVSLAGWREAHGREGGLDNPSTEAFEKQNRNVGAQVMGRNMFG